jgi:hypothetical protein
MKRWLWVLVLCACGGSGAGGKLDAASVDGAVADGASLDGAPFCPTSTSGPCDPATQYCYRVLGGATSAAADANVPPAVLGCNPIPSACLPSPTCACVLATGRFISFSSCDTGAGLITVTTPLP